MLKFSGNRGLREAVHDADYAADELTDQGEEDGMMIVGLAKIMPRMKPKTSLWRARILSEDKSFERIRV
jgi:hypothetical protein